MSQGKRQSVRFLAIRRKPQAGPDVTRYKHVTLRRGVFDNGAGGLFARLM